MKNLAFNKRAKFDYEILEKHEAGLMLKGFEVKSIREGRMSLKGAYVTFHDGELFLINANIPLYKLAGKQEGYDPTASRKLLLHKKEIERLAGKLEAKGLTLIPISVYNKKNRIKLAFGLGKGKRKIDKRQTIKKREDQRNMGRMMKMRR